MTMLDHVPTDTPHSSGSEENPIQADGLWFEDGNLILKAENTLFRVYGGLLAARSSVFRDMLGFPPPEDGNATMDGCPIVTVYDSAKDMAYFLRAVFDSRCASSMGTTDPDSYSFSSTTRSSFFEPAPAQTELPILEGILRLSLKYDVKYLHRRALDHLLTTFPTTLKAWKQRDDIRTIPPVDNTPFAAFRLAREFDLVWLLPSIIYCICSHPFDKTLDHASWGEGESSERIELPWGDKRMCILGRQNVIMAQNRNALAMMKLASTTVADCSGETCVSTRQRCADLVSGWDMAGLLDYFEDNGEEYFPGLCTACRASFRALCAAQCQGMWNDLPNTFGLGDWETLEVERRRAME